MTLASGSNIEAPGTPAAMLRSSQNLGRCWYQPEAPEDLFTAEEWVSLPWALDSQKATLMAQARSSGRKWTSTSSVRVGASGMVEVVVEVDVDVVVDGIGLSTTRGTVTGTAVVVVVVEVVVLVVVLVVLVVTSWPDTGKAPTWAEHPVRTRAKRAALM